MDDETHRYIDKSVEVVSAQNDTRFTKASSEVKDVQAEMSVTKTELGAKVDGVETQVGSLRMELTAKVDSSKTELTAKIDSLDTEMKSGFQRLNDRLNAQNPLTSWQIFGVVMTAVAAATGTIYGLMMLAGVSFVAPDNQREIVDLLEILIAQNEAANSQNQTPEIAPGTQGPDEGGSDTLLSEERN